MPSPTSATAETPRPSVRSIPRPQARSAGMAERPGRNENLSDLVRFFQTQNMPASLDSTTALPAVQSPKAQMEKMDKEQLKPLHRRLLQFTQRQKKESSSSPKSKQEEQQRQIEALQREGYLIPSSSKPASSSRSTRSKNSVDRSSITKSKRQDIETIGQPWLAKENRGVSPRIPDNKRRLASLDLGDFGSMVDVAVSLTSTDGSSPPPYQPPASNPSQSNQGPASQSTSSLPPPNSADARPQKQNAHRPASSLASTVDTQGSGSGDGFTHRPSSSDNSSVRAVERGAKPSSQAPSNTPASVHIMELSARSMKSEPKQDHDPDQRTQTPDRPPPNPPGAPAQPGLKLFPDVGPRVSSKNAWRLSTMPRYQTPTGKSSGLKDSQGGTPATIKPADKEQSSDKSSSGSTKDEAEPVCSGALEPSKESTESSRAENPTSEPDSQAQIKPRPQSLALGLKAFPLPAPTRPLPSIPDVKRVPSAPLDVKAHSTIRAVRSVSGLRIMDLQHSQPPPIAEDPREPGSRPATALGYAGEGDAAADNESLHSRTSQERPKSTEPAQHTPRWRASSVRIPRMHDLHESPIERDGDQKTPDGQPVADTPVLGQQITPTELHGKCHARKGLYINSRVDRNNLPFGLPSPPPTAALPTDPPQVSVERPANHRNFTAPTGVAVPSARSLDAPFGQAVHRASIISRSDSSRSSLRHESIPESNEHNHCESPIPSSDDDGFGPASQTVRRPRTTGKYSKRKDPIRRGYETVDARPSHGLFPFPHQTRPLTPQGPSSHSFEQTASPQSQYSQSTYRSRESHSSYHTEVRRGRAANFLEDRVANLERQNQILQAALMAALNAGAVKNHMDNLRDASMSPVFPASGVGNPYQNRSKPRPESWVGSSHSSESSGFETPSSLRDRRADVRQLDNMIEDIEAGWLSDKSSLCGTRMARHP